ncbi:MAG TPA: hypothetical protein VK618_02565 [Flavitalea sp.]|nr:hypothetical protein [Flavitalea sp.]
MNAPGFIKTMSFSSSLLLVSEFPIDFVAAMAAAREGTTAQEAVCDFVSETEVISFPDTSLKQRENRNAANSMSPSADKSFNCLVIPIRK